MIPRIVAFRNPGTAVDAPVDAARLLAGAPRPTVDNRYSDASQSSTAAPGRASRAAGA